MKDQRGGYLRFSDYVLHPDGSFSLRADISQYADGKFTTRAWKHFSVDTLHRKVKLPD